MISWQVHLDTFHWTLIDLIHLRRISKSVSSLLYVNKYSLISRHSPSKSTTTCIYLIIYFLMLSISDFLLFQYNCILKDTVCNIPAFAYHFRFEELELISFAFITCQRKNRFSKPLCRQSVFFSRLVLFELIYSCWGVVLFSRWGVFGLGNLTSS